MVRQVGIRANRGSRALIIKSARAKTIKREVTIPLSWVTILLSKRIKTVVNTAQIPVIFHHWTGRANLEVGCLVASTTKSVVSSRLRARRTLHLGGRRADAGCRRGPRGGLARLEKWRYDAHAISPHLNSAAISLVVGDLFAVNGGATSSTSIFNHRCIHAQPLARCHRCLCCPSRAHLALALRTLPAISAVRVAQVDVGRLAQALPLRRLQHEVM